MLIGLSACVAPSAFADGPPADPEPDDPKSKARYDQLMAAIMAKLPAASPE
jgi:hypothetical protein